MPGKDVLLRSQVLHSMNVLDTPPEETFDRITRLASASIGVPIALVSLVDEDRQWFKSVCGLDMRETPIAHSFCGHAVEGNDPLIIPDATRDARFADNPFVVGEEAIRFYAGVPLRSSEGVRVGTVCVLDRIPRTLTAKQLEILRDLAAITAHELELRRVASTDALTGAWNRRMLDMVATNEFNRARRVGRPFSVAIVDIDHFKLVNDRFGHEAGDGALFAFADIFRKVMRTEDWLFRIGGEEFAAVLIGAGRNAAADAMDRFRREIAGRAFVADRGTFTLTMSGAVAQAANDDGTPAATLPQLLDIVDRGLYRAKSEGRNRIVAVT
ncbi:sensor domain-containing diguanylate cyclase [Aquabacter spiritensis]|nr:sensor domain-containing diguanylate cyclase [Aquabacter spiritensis]